MKKQSMPTNTSIYSPTISFRAYLIAAVISSSRTMHLCIRVPKSMNFLSSVAVNVLQDWPKYSPDMNPIEHVWSWMSMYVKGRAPIDKASLERAVELAWQNLPQNVIRGYIDNLKRVCRQVIAAGGNHI